MYFLDFWNLGFRAWASPAYRLGLQLEGAAVGVPRLTVQGLGFRIRV